MTDNLWLLWELVLTDEPVLIISNSPARYNKKSFWNKTPSAALLVSYTYLATLFALQHGVIGSCSEAILALVSLIAPLKYNADFR